MVRGVFRYRRGPKVTQPFAVATFANGSDRTPIVVIVFGFETGDVAVGYREIHQRKQSGILRLRCAGGTDIRYCQRLGQIKAE